jgi:hypothetical protein
MKIIVSALLAVFFVSSSYSEIPAQPNPQEGKVAVQFVKVECPQTAPYTLTTDHMINPRQLFEDASCRMKEYPVLYARVGHTVTNDLRETQMLAEDYRVIDDKPTPVKKPHKLGWLLTVTIAQVENGVVDLEFRFLEKYLQGYDDISIAEDQSVRMPKLSVRDINSDAAIVLGNWCTFGGLETKSDHENEKIIYYFVRVMDSNSKGDQKTVNTGEWYPKETPPGH